MKKVFFTLFVSLMAYGLMAQNNVITYTASNKLPDADNTYGASGFNADAFNADVVSHVFDSITQTGTITFDDDIRIMSDHAFSGCDKLKTITLPASLTSIGNYAFSSCSQLQAINLPPLVENIGVDAFFCCFRLTSITLPAALTTIAENAFRNCEFSSITCLGHMPPICDEKCFGNTSWEITIYVAFGSLRNYMQDEVFSNFKTVVELEAAVGDKFVANKMTFKITALDEQNTATIIAQYPYYEGTIEIPEIVTYSSVSFTVTAIDEDAFANCKELTSVSIPATVDTIGKRAFYGCSELTSVVCEPTTPPGLGINAFSNCNASLLITVPYVAWNDYKMAWSAYANKIQASFDNAKAELIEEIDAKIEGITIEYVLNLADTAKANVNNASTIEQLYDIRLQTLAAIDAAIGAYNAAKDELPTQGTSGPAVVVTLGDKSVTLLNPEKVTYKTIE